MKNFYQYCQIAHIINQLVELSNDFKTMMKGKISIKFLWETMRGFMTYKQLKTAEITDITARRHHIYTMIIDQVRSCPAP